MITINGAEFSRLKIEADKFDRTIVRSLRKRIRAIGADAVAEVKKNILRPPIDDQPGSVGSRAAVAAGTSIVTSFSKRGGGVKITSTNRNLDRAHRGFAAAYESKSLRHPVYGKTSTVVDQPTRPYFGETINKVLDRRGQPEIMAAIDDAVRALGGHGK